MKVTLVDERNSSWEDGRPRFRVYLHPAATGSSTLSSTATYDVTGADVLQVIDWAQRNAAGGAYAVALVYDDAHREERNPGDGRGLVWLVGRDGNDWPGIDADEAQALGRMVDRREAPVGIPDADRAPDAAPEPDLEAGSSTASWPDE